MHLVRLARPAQRDRGATEGNVSEQELSVLTPFMRTSCRVWDGYSPRTFRQTMNV